MKKKLVLIIILVLVIGIVAFRNISFKNDYIIIDKINGSMELKIPKYSFNFQKSDNNISIKNLRSSRVIKKELKKILMDYSKENYEGKDYYYNEKDNYTIIDYGINDYLLFNTVYMKYVEGNYVKNLKLKEEFKKYQEMIGDFKALTFGVNESSKNLSIAFYPVPSNTITQQFEASLVIAHKKSGLEVSHGILTIENGKLVYTRTEINEKNEELKIPTQSTFTIIEKGVLLLDDNYLSNYEEKIILK